MMHVHHLSVMVVDNGFVVQEQMRPSNETVTLVAYTEEELIEVLRTYILKQKEQKA